MPKKARLNAMARIAADERLRADRAQAVLDSLPYESEMELVSEIERNHSDFQKIRDLCDGTTSVIVQGDEPREFGVVRAIRNIVG